MSKRPKTFTDLLDSAENYRWPKKGDRLLRDSEDWDRGVEFSRDEISRHVHIWNGYMNAGAALIDACEEEPHERKHHDLWQLWKLCKQIVIEVGGEDESIPVVEQVIKDFHVLDKSALAFRYSRDKNGFLIALPDRTIDLENIRDVMEAVSGFFEGADGLLDANVSAVDW